MNTQTLLRLPRSDPIIARRFGGVFARDLLPNNRGYYQSFIVNTDSSLEKEPTGKLCILMRMINALSFVLTGLIRGEALKYLSITIRRKWNGIRNSYNIPKQHLVDYFASIFYDIYPEN
ncbi:hypothetical protein TNCV_1896411 [Trichonephila clavipes]|nr:hypothetical protein TNCV_1896411 [Trichonephila clavipes]